MARGLLVALFIYSIVLSIRFTSSQLLQVFQRNEALSKEKHYHKVESNNSTSVEIHLLLDFFQAQSTPDNGKTIQLPQKNKDFHLEQNLENVLSDILNGNWSNKVLLLELAELTKDLNARIQIFSVLWKTLQSSNKVHNPFELITLYQQMSTLSTSGDFVHNEEQVHEIEGMKLEVRQALTTRSSQVLQAAAFIPNKLQNTTLKILLHRLNELEYDEIFLETLNKIYDAVEDLVTVDQLALVVSNFSINTKQNVIANLQLLERIRTSSHNESVKKNLIDNLKVLVQEYDFDKLTPDWRMQVNSYLPKSMSILYNASKLCIRNATNPTRYLYECPQTYLMCTNPKQLQQAAFLMDRNDAGLFSFRSSFWSNRYIQLEASSNATISLPNNQQTFIKNVYSKHGASYWIISFNGEFARFMDPTGLLYLCGGNSDALSGGEQHVYTRNVANYMKYPHECHWIIEDCS